jgi:hypothetical protein
MKDNLKVKGVVTIKIFDENQECIDTIVNNNLVVSSGLDFFINKLIGESVLDIAKIGVGEGETAPAMGDTNLESATNYKQAIGSIAQDTDNSFIVDTTIGDNYGGNTVSEICLFATDAYDVDTLVARTVLGASQQFTKTNGQDIIIFWQITLG